MLSEHECQVIAEQLGRVVPIDEPRVAVSGNRDGDGAAVPGAAAGGGERAPTHGEARDDRSWLGVLFGGREACAVLVPAKWC